jgi:NADH-quinone oxidoreductase subunit N
VYGYSGSLSYADIAQAIATPSSLDTLLLVGSLLILAGLLFKVGAVPFHTWTPDVYQGAPTPITGFMAACTKVAAFGALLRVVYTVIPGLHWDVNVGLWAVAIATMVVGTGIALVQTDMKRMLAYSSIAHAGFILTGMVSLDRSGITAVLFYLLVYGIATVGSFGVVWLVRERAGDELLGEATHVSQWAGLGRRNPAIALTFAVFLLSFAGIPLTAGFAGKFGVFSAAVRGGDWPLALIGVLASSAAAFFYVRIIVLMFFTGPAGEHDAVVGDGGGAVAAAAPRSAELVQPAGGGVAVATEVSTATAVVEADLTEPEITTAVVKTEGFALVAIAVCAVLTIVLGIFPSGVVTAISHVSTFLP